MYDTFVPCDTCRQRSYVFALLQSGLELSLCAHHGREAKPKLLSMGAIIDDYSAYINA